MTLNKHSVKISGHDTSITLEDEFWYALKAIALDRKISVNQLITEIDQDSSQRSNLSSSIRIFILKTIQSRNNTDT